MITLHGCACNTQLLASVPDKEGNITLSPQIEVILLCSRPNWVLDESAEKGVSKTLAIAEERFVCSPEVLRGVAELLTGYADKAEEIVRKAAAGEIETSADGAPEVAQ